MKPTDCSLGMGRETRPTFFCFLFAKVCYNITILFMIKETHL